MTAEPFVPFRVAHLAHQWPSGDVRVRLNGSPLVFTSSSREEALRLAHQLGGARVRILESIEKKRTR